jgi:outer membrane biosynthesis protein TonB
MVQWTDKPAPAPKPQVAPEELKAEDRKERKPDAAPRPVARKARKSRMAGTLQVVTICGVFGLIVTAVLMFKDMKAPSATASPTAASASPASPGTASAATQERDPATGRIVVMDRDQCRELGFDNQSGKMVHKGAVNCHDAAHGSTTGQSLYRHPTNRLDHIRRSFAQ